MPTHLNGMMGETPLAIPATIKVDSRQAWRAPLVTVSVVTLRGLLGNSPATHLTVLPYRLSEAECKDSKASVRSGWSWGPAGRESLTTKTAPKLSDLTSFYLTTRRFYATRIADGCRRWKNGQETGDRRQESGDRSQKTEVEGPQTESLPNRTRRWHDED